MPALSFEPSFAEKLWRKASCANSLRRQAVLSQSTLASSSLQWLGDRSANDSSLAQRGKVLAAAASLRGTFQPVELVMTPVRSTSTHARPYLFGSFWYYIRLAMKHLPTWLSRGEQVDVSLGAEPTLRPMTPWRLAWRWKIHRKQLHLKMAPRLARIVCQRRV